MAYTVTNLITEAYYDSSVVSRQFETIQGYQLNDGLFWLNQILGDKAVDNGDIPYITVQYPLNLVAGQESYFIPGLVDIEAVTFYIGANTLGYNAENTVPQTNVVRYQMQYIDRIKYFGQNRADGINSLPLSYTYERQFGGSTIWMYFWPQSNYLCHITGNFFLNNVTLNQDLTSPITTANLGVPTILGTVTNLGACTIIGTGVLAANELVINGVDLAGTYTTVAALVSAINTNVPKVSATASGTTVFLYGSTPNIVITTIGTVGAAGLTFANFSLTGGPLTHTYVQPGTLTTGQLVINTIDLAGTYPTVAALAAYINTGIIPFVTASVQNFQLILSSATGVGIYIVTSGNVLPATGIDFQDFSTTSGPFSQNFYATAFDQFYIDYLEFLLAERICRKLNFAVPQGVQDQLAEYKLQISKMAEPLDLTCQKISCMGRDRGINYAQINIGRGWTTS